MYDSYYNKIFVPYIDVYQTQIVKTGMGKYSSWTKEQFDNFMLEMAKEYGTQSIGEQVLRTGQPIPCPDYPHVYIMAYGTYANKDYECRCIYHGDTREYVVTESDGWDSECDVT